MSDWQPIETAPKDGTKILAYGVAVDGIPLMMWDDAKPRVPHMEVIEWVEGWYDRDEEVSPGLFRKVPTQGYAYWGPNPQQFRVTHWMPLPAPPKGGKPVEKRRSPAPRSAAEVITERNPSVGGAAGQD